MAIKDPNDMFSAAGVTREEIEKEAEEKERKEIKKQAEEKRKEEEKQRKRERQSKNLEKIIPILAFILIGRGLINLFVPFDEYFIGSDASLFLNVLTLFGGIGVLFRRQYGVILGFWMSLIAFIAQTDANFISRSGGEIMSLLLMTGLWQGYDHKKFVKGRYDNKVAFALILILFAVIAADALKPSPEQYAAIVTQEAIEKGDWRVCGKLTWGQERCKSSVVVSKKDPGLCKIVNSNNVRFDCYVDVAQALNNESICDLMDESIINEGLGFGENRTDECKGLV